MKLERGIFAALFLAAIVCLYATHDERGPTARITADAWYYHVYTVSLVNDRDLDFTDEYRVTGNWYRFGPTPTGRPGNPFGIGAPLMTVPLYLVGTLVAKLTGGDTGGFGTAQIRLIVLASPLFSLGAAIFAWRLCRRRLGSRFAALAGPIAILLAGPVLYYAIRQPGYAHPQATFFTAWLVDAWDASYDRPRSLATWLGLGALAGATALARPQLAPWAFLLVVAAVDDLRARKALLGPLLGAVAAFVVFLPQLLAWKVVYGSFVVVPQGPGFMVWGAPAFFQVLFSARNGLFAWAPLYAIAAVGLLVALRRFPRLSACLLVGFLLQVWTNGAVWDWWAGGSYGGRRFDSCYVVFAFGLGVLLAGRARWIFATLAAVCAAGGIALAAVSNVFNLEGHESETPPAYLARKAPGPGHAVGALSWLVTLPARAAFSVAHGAPLSAYDRVEGIHLLSEFYPGLLGRPSKISDTVTFRGDEPILVGFDGTHLRGSEGTILVSLNRRHGPLTMTLRLSTTENVALRWDGRPLEVKVEGQTVTAVTDAIERGVHDLGLTAPPGTSIVSLRVDLPATAKP